MSKFISFTKLVDGSDLMVNMDFISNMAPVRKLYGGQMIDCTDLYYEDHRITVVASLDDILEAMGNMGDNGVENMTITPVDQNSDEEVYELPEDETTYVNITITGYKKNSGSSPDKDHHIIFLSYLYDGKPFGSNDDADFTKTINIPEGRNYAYVVYVECFENTTWIDWVLKDNSDNACVFASEAEALEFINNNDSNSGNFGQISCIFSDPVKVPLDVAFDLLNDHYDDFDLPVNIIYCDYEIRQYGKNESNVSYISFAKTATEARNLLPYVNPNDLFIGTNGPSNGIYKRQFPVTPVAEADHTYYVVIKINYKRKGRNRVTTNIHTAYPIKLFSYDSDADAYLNQISSGIDVSQTGYEYKKFNFKIGHLYKYGYFSSGLSFVLQQ